MKIDLINIPDLLSSNQINFSFAFFQLIHQRAQTATTAVYDLAKEYFNTLYPAAKYDLLLGSPISHLEDNPYCNLLCTQVNPFN